jgi:hypothetical protein
MNKEQLMERMEELQSMYWTLRTNAPEWLSIEYHGLVDQLADIEEAEQAIDTNTATMP